MDEDSPKSSDNEAEDSSSPRKKMKTDDDLQQPSTSGMTGASTSCGMMASTSSAVPERSSPTADRATGTRQWEPLDDTSGREDDEDDGFLADAGGNSPRPPRARSASADRSRAEDDEARSDDAFIQNLERSVERLRRNVRRLTNRHERARNGGGDNGTAPNAAQGGENPAANNGIDRPVSNRIRNQIANNIAQLFAPNVFRGYDTSEDSIDSIDAVENGENDEEDNRSFLYDGENSSESDSSSATSSSSSAISSSSESYPSYGHTSGSEYELAEFALRDDVNVDTLDCLKTSSVKCKWNVVRDLCQRQHGVQFRQTPATVGRFYPSQFQKRAYGSVNLVQRLGLMHKLVHHQGCVNCLNFHPNGKLLASGSDDLRINLWNWETKKLLKSIRSGHKNNVFQAKFMVCDGYRDSDLELISTGRDGCVRHTIVAPSGQSTTKQIFRSPHAIHKVATLPARNGHVFLMAGEDETVRMCDMRQGKVQTVVEVGKRLYSIATHPFGSEFCVAGNGSCVQVYDLRYAQNPKIMLAPSEPIVRPLHASITCAVYNHVGSEILASYSEGDIHLFKLDPSDRHVVSSIRFRGHCNIKTIKGVSFFGLQSEYVASGSDCGYIYLWEKSSQTIVNWLRSNPGDVVNCLEPHPEFPILASSGVEDDVKIWVPKGLMDDQQAPLFEPNDLKRYVRRNLDHRRNTYRADFGLRVAPLSRFFPTLTYRRHSLNRFNRDDGVDPLNDDYGRSRLDCSPS